MAYGIISVPATWLYRTVVEPSWLQNVQDVINGIMQMTGTVKGLLIDGTGGATGSAVANAVKFTGAGISGTSTPTPTPSTQALYKDLIPVAWATGTVSGTTLTFRNGVNISSMSRTGVGAYTINLINGTTNENAICPIATKYGNAGYYIDIAPVVGTPCTQLLLKVYDATGANQDSSFSLVVFGA